MNLSFDLQLFGTETIVSAKNISISDKTIEFKSGAGASVSLAKFGNTSFAHFAVNSDSLVGNGSNDATVKSSLFGMSGSVKKDSASAVSVFAATSLALYGTGYNYKIAQTNADKDLGSISLYGKINLELNGFKSGLTVANAEAGNQSITFTNSSTEDEVVLSGYNNKFGSSQSLKFVNDTGEFTLGTNTSLADGMKVAGGRANTLTLTSSGSVNNAFFLKGDDNASVVFKGLQGITTGEVNHVKKASFTLGSAGTVSISSVKNSALVITGNSTTAATITAESIMSGSTAQLKGGGQNDVISLSSVKDFGSVSIEGGAGNDTINLSGTGNEIVIGNEGNDKIVDWFESAGDTGKGNTISLKGGFKDFATAVSGVEGGQAFIGSATVTSSDATKYGKLGMNVTTTDDGTVSALLVGKDSLQSGANIKFDNYSYIVADTNTGTLNLGDTSKKVVFLGNTTAGDDNWGDTNAYVNITSVVGSSGSKNLLIGGLEDGGATIKASGTSDSVWGGDNGKGDVIKLTDNKSQIVYSGANDGLDSVAEGFTKEYKAGKSNYVRFLDGVTYMSAEKDKFIVGADSLNGVDITLTTTNNKVAYGFGLEGGDTYVAAVDVSDGGSSVAYGSDVNMYFGQGEKSTITIAASAGAAKLNWDGGAGTSSIGVIDGKDAADGSILVGSTDMAQSIAGSNKGASSISGGFVVDKWTDKNADTLVGSTAANKATTFFVGANMGNDEIQNVANGDTITFLGTKFSDLVNFKYDATDTDLTFKFAGSTVEASLVSGKKLSAVSNVTFNFDDAKYVWDGKVFNYTNPNA